jgi:hypothetical protein
LLGHKVHLYTDSIALRYVFNKPTLSPKLTWWSTWWSLTKKFTTFLDVIIRLHIYYQDPVGLPSENGVLLTILLHYIQWPVLRWTTRTLTCALLKSWTPSKYLLPFVNKQKNDLWRLQSSTSSWMHTCGNIPKRDSLPNEFHTVQRGKTWVFVHTTNLYILG